MIGPAIGSWAWRIGGHTAPGFVAAALCLVNLGFAVRFLPEPAESRRSGQQSSFAVLPLREVLRAAFREPLLRMIAIYFMGIGAFASITAIFPLFLEARFGIDESTVGYVFLAVGAVSVLVRGVAVGPLVQRFGEPTVSRLGAAVLALGLVAGAVAEGYALLGLAITFIATGTGTLFPPLAALISRSTAPEVQGSTLGVNQFFGGVARVLGPLWGAAVFDLFSAAAPFFTAAVGVSIAFLLAVGLQSPPGAAAAAVPRPPETSDIPG